MQAYRIVRSTNRFPVAETEGGKFAVVVKNPSGVVAVLVPRDESKEGAEKIAAFLEKETVAVVTMATE